MSSNTKQFKELKRRIDYLISHSLPASNPSGHYTQKQKDEIRSFLLLSHAEFEYYFEDIGKQTAKQALDKWLADHNFKSKVLMYLAAFIEDTVQIKKADTAEEKIKAIVGQYFVTLKNNNGIKEDSILKILCPIGIEQNQIDNTWLNTITSFGSNRGEIAHTSARTQSLKDPSDILTDINYLMTELSALDVIIKRLS